MKPDRLRLKRKERHFRSWDGDEGTCKCRFWMAEAEEFKSIEIIETNELTNAFVRVVSNMTLKRGRTLVFFVLLIRL